MANGEKKDVTEVTQEQLDQGQQIFVDIVAKYYGDPDYRAKMDADPTGTLKSEGFDFPEGVKIRLLFNTDKLMHVVLPVPTVVANAMVSDLNKSG